MAVFKGIQLCGSLRLVNVHLRRINQNLRPALGNVFGHCDNVAIVVPIEKPATMLKCVFFVSRIETYQLLIKLLYAMFAYMYVPVIAFIKEGF